MSRVKLKFTITGTYEVDDKDYEDLDGNTPSPQEIAKQDQEMSEEISPFEILEWANNESEVVSIEVA